MDIQTIDQEYQQLQNQAQQTIGKMQMLADKLRAANLAGNQDAREWMLDLKEITLAIQAEQNQVSAVLQALHGFVMRQAEQVPAHRSRRQAPGRARHRRLPERREAIMRSNRTAGEAACSAFS